MRISYGPDRTGEEIPYVYSNQITQRFDYFSAPLEKPFKELWGDASREDGGDVGARDNIA